MINHRHLFGAAFLISTASLLKCNLKNNVDVGQGQTKKSSQVTPTSDAVAITKVNNHMVVPFQAIPCPVQVSVPPLDNQIDLSLNSRQPARLELENGEDEAQVFWLDMKSRQEVLVQSLGPHQHSKLATFVGDRFIIRSAAEATTVLLDVTVGVHHIQLPSSLADCVTTTGLGGVARKKPPPGSLTDSATIRGWTNESPCDLLASWVWPNGTERWMADMLANDWAPHYEITYMSHDFVFRLTDGRLVKKFTVAPTKVPSCPAATAPAVSTNERLANNSSASSNLMIAEGTLAYASILGGTSMEHAI